MKSGRNVREKWVKHWLNLGGIGGRESDRKSSKISINFKNYTKLEKFNKFPNFHRILKFNKFSIFLI